ncbi:MAG TPA: type II toxin-antitoxin system prevent-host-death family antitoxin [Stellaceae bacterium]|nr:type II toxin-antitoxin system prevent-host-death family antitoxin [Stellaceae bacterium]
MVKLLDHVRRENDIPGMTAQFNIAEAKAKLSELLDRALAGEDIVIARAGEPMARLTALKRKRPRKPGAWRGWGADIPTEVFLAPMDDEDLDAAEGKFSDEFGISLPEHDDK